MRHTHTAVVCAVATTAATVVIWTNATVAAAGAIGMNIGSNTDWGTQAIWTDVSNTFRQWGTQGQPWIADPSLTYTADGYPLQPAGAISHLYDYPDGVYKLTYEGGATVTAQGMGVISNVVRNGNLTTANITVTHSKASLLDLEVTGIDPANPLRNLTLMMPGTIPGQVFTNAFTRRLAPFDTLRFMDLSRTNDNTVQTWSQRTTPSTSIQTGANGIALEHMITLANQTGKNPWFNVPAEADDDYIRNMAKLVRQQLAPGRTVYLEYSNEVWNKQFFQYAQVLADAKANPALTATDDAGRVRQQYAFRAKQVGDLFRAEFGADAGRVKLVLAGQAASSGVLSSGLTFLQNTYGRAGMGVDAIALAPYVTIPNSADVPGLTLEGLFAAMNTELDTTVSNQIKSSATLAKQYGLPMLAYEGGQHLLPWNANTRDYTNQDLKAQANRDRRMGDILIKLDSIWRQNGGDLFEHFSFVARDSNFGYFGELQDITDPGSAKWDALVRMTQPIGDADLSGTVDGNDLDLLMSHLGQSGMWWEQGDFTGDGRVNADDLAIIDLALTKQRQTGIGTAIVPEPGAGAFLVGGVALLSPWLRRRRKAVRHTGGKAHMPGLLPHSPAQTLPVP